jgi:hypothetical protein
MGSIWADPEDDVRRAKIPIDFNLFSVDHLLARLRDPSTDMLTARDRILFRGHRQGGEKTQG